MGAGGLLSGREGRSDSNCFHLGLAHRVYFSGGYRPGCVALTLEIPMPIYTYRCAKCGKDFEITESMKDHATKKHRCPSCRSTRVERVLTPAFAKTSRKS